MSTLQERLDQIKAGFLGQVPDEVKNIMANAEEEIRGSGIMSRVAEAGSGLPSFDLADTDGSTVGSADLLARGPLVLTVYRGAW